MASTTVKTVSAPATIAWAAYVTVTASSAGVARAREAGQHATRALVVRGDLARRFVRRLVDRPDESRGPQERDDADDEHAGVPLTASMIPPMPGPRKMLALSIVPATAFDAVSSTGVAASFGVSAACAGRKGVPTTG